MTANGLRAGLAGALCVLAVVVGWPPAVAACGVLAVLTANYVDLSGWIRSVTLRRLVRLIPYAVVVVAEAPDLAAPPWWSWPMCLVPVLAWQAMTWRRTSKVLKLARLGLFPPESADQRAGRFVTAFLSAPAQECLHRGVVLVALVPFLGWGAVLLATATFVAEHVLHSNPLVRTTTRDVILWVAISLLFGAAVYLHPAALWPAIVAHGLVNLPNVVRALTTIRRTAWQTAS